MGNFWDQVEEIAENAPEAGYSNVSFGRLIATPQVIWWTTEGEGESKVREAHRKPFEDGYQLKEGESMEVNFVVKISELNPNLQFEYDRTVSIRKSGKQKTDWWEIVLPSLERVFGKKWAQAMGAQPYVAVEDVPNIGNKTTKKDPSKVWGVPKFIEVYPTKEACIAARDARYGGSAAAPASSSAEIPGEVIQQVKGLINSVGKDKALGMLADKPFGPYEPATLIELATA